MKYIWEEFLVIWDKFWDEIDAAIVFGFSTNLIITGLIHHKYNSTHPYSDNLYYYGIILFWLIGGLMNWFSMPKRTKVEVSITITLSILSFTIWYPILLYLLYSLIRYILVTIINIPKKYKDLPDI